MSRHMPGPWEAKAPDLVVKRSDGKMVTIAVCQPSAWADANAHLISAAPELRQIVFDIVRDCGDLVPDDYLERMRDAIAKSDGVEP